MRLLDQDPIDPEIAATLDAIDATLAGEPVDARYAELAEIALLLASDRPQVPPEFARSMDERVGRRFAPAGRAGAGQTVAAGAARRRRLARRFWETAGALAAGVALIVAIVVVAGGGGGASSASSSSASSSAASSPAVSGAAASSTATAPARAPAPLASAAPHTSASSAAKAQASSTVAPAQQTSGSSPAVLQPPTTGRKVVQSAQLNLTAAPSHIDAVAQEVYDVVGQVNGIVNSSSVTQGGPTGYANFQLSVPSASLAQTMSRLSQLTYAQVASRTDNTQDITGQFDAATRALADARALRTSLLKQLENATTTEEVDSLKAQINDAEASISSDEATLARLNNQVNFSQINLQINASTPPVPVSHGGGGFGIGRAAHDAGRVLTVAAGVALIVLAALTPVGLVVALFWWVGAAVRRRRREQALDSV
ncbi:MAG TPA: DUF4349 domain-containing protein [Solirubrobacteraceae bacterium]|nr:DUF4349 domain-containing protein [Solirubrobacteraceae bacterium]